MIGVVANVRYMTKMKRVKGVVVVLTMILIMLISGCSRQSQREYTSLAEWFCEQKGAVLLDFTYEGFYYNAGDRIICEYIDWDTGEVLGKTIHEVDWDVLERTYYKNVYDVRVGGG